MQRIQQAYTMATADADGVAQSQTPASGGVQNLTINGALASGGVATMDVPRHVSIASAGNDAARTFTVTGTDRYGQTMSETITGPNATTVKGTKNFKTVTAVTVDDNTAGAITVGSADELEGPVLPLDIYRNPFNVGIGVKLSSGASLTYTLQHTFDQLRREPASDPFVEDSLGWHDHADINASTASEDGNIAFPVYGVRLKVTSFTSGTATLTMIQSGLSGA